MLGRKIRSAIEAEQFHPGVLGMFVNPFYFARKGLHRGIARFAGRIRGATLDVGCGRKPYEGLFHVTRYVGLEIDTPANRSSKKADRFYDGKVFPFGDGEFDSAVVNEVFEHVFNPDEFLRELNRVLKPGGLLLMTVPFAWDEHDIPHDYARYSSFGLAATLGRHGFSVLEQVKSMGDIRAVVQMLTNYIYVKTATGNGYFDLLACLLLIAPFNVLGEVLALVLPRNDRFYLDNIVLARKDGPGAFAAGSDAGGGKTP
ncbi:MAG: class I SAM-dependent methyltransferase [Deltaproteobacteria bacterium]